MGVLGVDLSGGDEGVGKCGLAGCVSGEGVGVSGESSTGLRFTVDSNRRNDGFKVLFKNEKRRFCGLAFNGMLVLGIRYIYFIPQRPLLSPVTYLFIESQFAPCSSCLHTAPIRQR